MALIFIGMVNRYFLYFLFLIIVIYGVFYIFFKKKVYSVFHTAKNNQSLYFSKVYEQLKKVKFVKVNSLYEWVEQRLTIPFNQL